MRSAFQRWCVHGAFGAACVLLLAAAAVCGWAGRLFPYEAIGPILTEHSNRAGAAFFDADYYAGAIQRGKWAGLVLAISSMGLAAVWAGWGRGEATGSWLRTARDGMAEFGRALGRTLGADRAAQSIVLASVGLRLLYLFQPVCSDEAKAYYAWTARPFLLAISDYRAPQHLLYTILSWPIVRMLGSAEWVIRLPALAAGIGLVVLAFVAGRKWFGREAGLFAAIFVAANPLLLHYSVNGRGYTLQTCAVLLLWLAAHGMAGDSRRRWPALLVVAGVMGLVAVPTTAFALVGTYLWLLTVLIRDGAGDRVRQWRGVSRLVACGMATVWLGVLAYLPAYVASDQWYSLDQDLPPGGRIPWCLIPGHLASFTGKAVKIWTNGFSPWATALLWILFGIGAGSSFRRRAFHLLLANMLGIYLVLVASGAIPYARTVLYQGAGFWILAGAGLAFFVRLAVRGRPSKLSRLISNGLMFGLMALLVANVFAQNRDGFTTVSGDRAPGVRDAMRFLKTAARPGDHLISLAPAAGPVYYYHLRYGMDCRLWLLPDEIVPPDILQDGHAVYWIVQTEEGLSPQYLLERCRWGERTPAWEDLVAVHSNRHAMVFTSPRGP